LIYNYPIGSVFNLLEKFMSTNTGGATVAEFSQKGTFKALRAAEDWLRARGFSWGSSQVDGPQAIWHGDCAISKWRNLSAAEKRECHAVMEGDGREGPMRITLRTGATEEARAAFALTDAMLAERAK
jgi:hypothetical protein